MEPRQPSASLTKVRGPQVGWLWVGALTLAACSAGPTPAPLPATWPAASLTQVADSDAATCLVSAPRPSTTSRDELPSDASSADLVWFPGLNAGAEGDPHGCRTFHTRLGKPQARALVAGLKALPDPPAGAINCPMDDGSFVQVWFTTSGGSVSFRIGLTGCRFDAPKNLGDLGGWPDGMPLPKSD